MFSVVRTSIRTPLIKSLNTRSFTSIVKRNERDCDCTCQTRLPIVKKAGEECGSVGCSCD